MPTFRKMMAEGASTLENRSILPSSSACNWASMFMGAGPELHGYTEWGSRTPELPSRVVNSDNRFPNIFGMYRDKAPEAEIGYIYEWEGMNYLVDTLAMSHVHALMSAGEPERCTRAAVQYIKELAEPLRDTTISRMVPGYWRRADGVPRSISPW